MSTVTERDGRFQVRVRHNKQCVARTFTTRRDALAWGRQQQALMESGRWAAQQAPTPTVGEALAEYRKGPVTKLKGRDTYSHWYNEIAAHDLARKRLADLTAHDLAQWRDAQEARHKSGTVVRKMGLFAGFLSWCKVERGWIASNPMHNVRKPRVNDARSRVFSELERTCLLEAARAGRAKWLADVLIVSLRSAMRRSEVWGLKSSDVDFEACTAYLADTKGGVSRSVPLDPQAVQALQRLADAAKAQGRETLVPVSDPHAITVAFRRTLGRARALYEAGCKAMGIEADSGAFRNLRWHDSRHTAASYWANTGALNVVQLAQVTGHRSLASLKRYAHIDAAGLAVKMAAIEA
jgi:integrase